MNKQTSEDTLLLLRRQYIDAVTAVDIVKAKIALAELEYLCGLGTPKAAGYFLEITEETVTVKRNEDSN